METLIWCAKIQKRVSTMPIQAELCSRLPISTKPQEFSRSSHPNFWEFNIAIVGLYIVGNRIEFELVIFHTVGPRNRIRISSSNQ